MRRTSTTPWLVAILVVAALVRLAWAVFTTHHPVGGPGGLDPDPRVYFRTASDIAQGNGYTRLGQTSAYFPPGYPYALAGVFWVVGHTPLPNDLAAAGAALNVALGVASVWLVYVLGRRVFDSTVGLVAAGIMALFPGPVIYTSAFLSETLFIFLVLLALVAGTAGWRGGAMPARRLVVFGALVGLATLTRPVGLVMLPALAVAGWAARAGAWRALAETGIALAACLLVMTPWTVRNAIAMDAFIPISNNGGDDLCIGHNRLASGAYQFPPSCFRPLATSPERYEVVRSRNNTKEALRWMWHNADREPGLVVKRARYTWDNDHEGLFGVESYGLDPFLSPGLKSVLRPVANVYFFAVCLLGLVGLRAFVGRDPRRLLVLVTTLGIALAPLAFFGNARFHEPALPMLAVAAAVTATALARRLATGSRPTAAPGVEV